MKIITTTEQAQMEELMDLLSKEDVIVVLGISRMARNSRALLNLINAMVEIETASTVKYQTKEMSDVHIGRPQKQLNKFPSLYLEVKAGRKSVSSCCRELGIARSTWYNRVRALEKEEEVDF